MAPLARYLPRLLSRDPVAKAHVVELIAASQSLDAYHRSHPASRFPLEPSRRLGEALGVLHRVFRWSQVVDDPDLAWLSGPMPWALQMHCPPLEILSHLSPAGLSLIGIVQGEPGLADRVGEAARSWQPDTVIHGDIKSENILVRQPTGPTGTPELTLVDWELVQVGDAAWDLAGALHDYLIFWTESMPMESAPAIDQMVKAARYPLESLRPAIRAFWAGYRSSAGLAQAEEARLLRRAVVDSAIRLMQSAEERAAERETLPAQAVLLLQISSNLLTDPARGQSVLYGLPTEFSS
jgi:Ser/Thr protein kinase RdoA (MazF antagonist)